MSSLIDQIASHSRNLPDNMRQEALDFIQFLESKIPFSLKNREARGAKMAEILDEGAKQGLFVSIKDPAVWQRKIRKDRDLPER